MYWLAGIAIGTAVCAYLETQETAAREDAERRARRLARQAKQRQQELAEQHRQQDLLYRYANYSAKLEQLTQLVVSSHQHYQQQDDLLQRLAVEIESITDQYHTIQSTLPWTFGDKRQQITRQLDALDEQHQLVVEQFVLLEQEVAITYEQLSEYYTQLIAMQLLLEDVAGQLY